jgi:hypothetical protein
MSATAPAVQTPLTSLPAWKALQSHYEKIRTQHLREIFKSDPDRGTRLTAEAVGIYFDYSKHRITDETVRLLLELAEQSGLRERIEAMFTGEKINITEKRAVLHTALRARRECCAGRARGAGSHGGFLESCAEWCVEGLHREADSQRHQYWDWRVGSGAGDGL